MLRTYIICEDGQENVWLIDKHAAHERVRFDALKNNTQPVMSQQLLSPLAVELSAEDAASLLEQLPLLEEFGFVCEDFGDGTVLVRQVPSDLEVGDPCCSGGAGRGTAAEPGRSRRRTGQSAPDHGLQIRHQGGDVVRSLGASGAGG